MMIESLSSPVANGLTWTLLHFLWQGLLIGLVYWALLAATDIRQARVRYAISLFALGVMALCPLVTFAVVYDAHAAVNETSAAVATSTSFLTEMAVDPLNPQVAGAPAADRQTLTEIASGFSESGGNRHGFTVVQRALDASQPFVLFLWLAGVMLSGARLTGGILNILSLRSGRTSIPPVLASRSLQFAHRFGLASARVFASTRIRSAAVVGFWKPVVLLPASWLTALPTDVLEAVIAHELAHIRRFDVWVNLLQRILETMLFYHPMVWWLSNRVRLEREMCCDELAVKATGERGNYVIALEQVGRLQVHRTMNLATSFTGDRKTMLLSRVQNVLKTTGKPQREPAWLVGVIAVALPLSVLGFSGFAPAQNAVIAQERDAARSAEGDAGPRRAAERDGQRRSAEGDAGPRRSAESERGRQRSTEGQGNREGNNALQGFKPQTQREDALYQMILQLQREMAAIRREMQDRRGTRDGKGTQRGPRDGESTARGPRDGEGTKRGPRDGEGTRQTGPRDGEHSSLSPRWKNTKEGKVFKAYDKNGDMAVTLDEWLMMFDGNNSSARRETLTKRFNDAEPSGDGKLTPTEFIYWYTKGRFENVREGGPRGLQDGERGRRGARDGSVNKGPRDG